MSHFLSICITSYNRPNELKRCLDSIDTEYVDRVEIIVGVDHSPLIKEINSVLNLYKRYSNIRVKSINHPINVGYDRNFYSLIQESSAEYILFVTDDDSFIPLSIDKVIEALRADPTPVAYTPFFDANLARLYRVNNKSFQISSGISSVERHLYDSILLSGLIFSRSKIPIYRADQLFGLIYSQVYVFICILYQYGGSYLHVPTIQYIGDGENGFGKNDGEESNPLLADRMHYLSNLEYNKKLVQIVNLFDHRFGTNLFESISKKYAIRTITGFCYSRTFGVEALKKYRIAVQAVGFKLGIWPHFYYYLLRIIGLRFVSVALLSIKSVRRKWLRL